MLKGLGEVLRDARESAGKSMHEVSVLADVRESNLSRLETGQVETWPRKTDQIIAGYAQATGIPELALWQRVIERMTARQASEALSAARKARSNGGSQPKTPNKRASDR